MFAFELIASTNSFDRNSNLCETTWRECSLSVHSKPIIENCALDELITGTIDHWPLDDSSSNKRYCQYQLEAVIPFSSLQYLQSFTREKNGKLFYLSLDAFNSLYSPPYSSFTSNPGPESTAIAITPHWIHHICIFEVVSDHIHHWLLCWIDCWLNGLMVGRSIGRSVGW